MNSCNIRLYPWVPHLKILFSAFLWTLSCKYYKREAHFRIIIKEKTFNEEKRQDFKIKIKKLKRISKI